MSDFTIGVLLAITLFIGFVLVILKMIHIGDEIYRKAMRASKPGHTYVLGLREDEGDD